MPLTLLEFPILIDFIRAVTRTTGQPPNPMDANQQQAASALAPPQYQQQQQQQQDLDDSDRKPKQLPKGVVLGPDGKPCRSCTSFASWAAMTKGQAPTSTSSSPKASIQQQQQPPADCPPDVEQLGRSTWSLLHSITATYPENPTATQQAETKQFLSLFGKLYPCWVCADDFRAWMKDGNEPRVSNRDEFGRWMCRAHNAVNEKLGKESFDCNRWEERWRTGWKDGRCG